MAFEKVSKNESVGRGNPEPMISIRASKTIGINGPALSKWFEDATHVVLYHDTENEKLGLKPDKGEDDDGYKISRSNSGGSVGCSGFLKQHGLVDESKTRQYHPEEDSLNGDTDLVVLDLENPDSTTTRSSQDSEEESE